MGKKCAIWANNIVWQLFIVILAGNAAGFSYKFHQVSYISKESWATYPISMILPNMLIATFLFISMWMIYCSVLSRLSLKPIKSLLKYDSFSFLPFTIMFFVSYLPEYFCSAIVRAFIIWKLLFFLINFSYKDLLTKIKTSKSTLIDIIGLTLFNGFMWHNMSNWILGKWVGGAYSINAATLAKYFQYPAWNPQMYAGGWSYIYGNPSGYLWYWLIGFLNISPLMLEQFQEFSLFIPYYSMVVLSCIGFYFLLKKTFNLSRVVCLFGGMVYLLNSYMFGMVAGETLHFFSYLTFPWVLLLVDYSLKRKRAMLSAYAAIVMHFPIAFFYYHPENFYIFYIILILFCLLSIFFYYEKKDLFPIKASFSFAIAHLCFSHFYLPVVDFFVNYKDAVNLGNLSARLHGFGFYVPFFDHHFIGIVPAFLIVASFYYMKNAFKEDFPVPRFLVVFSYFMFLFFSLTSLGKLTPIPDLLAASNYNKFPFVHYWVRFAPGLLFFNYIVVCIGLEIILKRIDLLDPKHKKREALSFIIISFITILIIKIGLHFNTTLIPRDIMGGIGSYRCLLIKEYFVIGVIALMSLIFFKNKTARNSIFFALAIIPIIHFMNPRVRLFDKSESMLKNIVNSELEFSGRTFSYVKRNPRDSRALDAFNEYISKNATSEQKNDKYPFDDLVLRADEEFKSKSDYIEKSFFNSWEAKNSNDSYKPFWNPSSDNKFLKPYLEDAEFNRFLEIGMATRSLYFKRIGFSFYRHLGHYANVVFDIAGNVGRPVAWRWFPQFDPYSPSEDFRGSADSCWFFKPERVDERLWIFNLLGVKHIVISEKDYLSYGDKIISNGEPGETFIYFPIEGESLETVKIKNDEPLVYKNESNNAPTTINFKTLQLRNDKALPLMFLADKYKILDANYEKSKKWDVMKKIDYRNTLLLEEKPVFPTTNENLRSDNMSQQNDKVDIIDIRGNIAAAKVNVKKAYNFLFYSDNYHADWIALIDGKRTKIYKTDIAFKSIIVPNGKHIIWMEFSPVSLCIGFFISTFSILVIAFCLYIDTVNKECINIKPN